MTPEQWRQIEDLYHAAQECGPGERTVLLEGSDPEIRSRVERMLALDSGGQILDQPVAGFLETSTLTVVSAGEQLGPYRLEAEIGAGGMGTVYRAVDTRLGRAVAIKTVHQMFGDRFEREARAISALNHPHICTLFDVGPNYLVMELLEGQTLKERIASGPFTNEELCSIGIPICEALDAAHSHGLVHRDIKPGNVFVTTSGIVKILDFGLAKTVGLPESDQAGADTLSQSGSTVGTVSYMSPEQARGIEVDAGTDLFSLGVVLYEMATGKLPFTGKTWADIGDALLNKTPQPVAELNPDLAPELAGVIERALEKDRNARYQSASDMRADLLRARTRLESGVAEANQVRPSRSQRGTRYLVAGSIGAALLAVLGVRLYHSPRVQVTDPSEYVQITSFADSARAPGLSPDGRMVTFIRGGGAFLATGQIYVKLLPDGESAQLSNDPLPKYGPVFTPDGSRVAYTQQVPVGGSVSWDTITVPVLGGQPTTFLPNAAGLTWIDQHRVLFSEIKTGIHMAIVTATDNRAESRVIYFPTHERGMAHYSYLSPDHKWVLIVEMDGTGEFQPCRLVPFDGSSAGHPVGPPGACTSAGWSPDGKWMYFSAYVGPNSHIWRQRVPDGIPEQITFGTTEEEGLAVAPDGRSIITSLGIRQSGVWLHDARGDRPISSEGRAFDPRLSPDGKRAHYLIEASSLASSQELYSTDLGSGATERALPGVSLESYDISPNGKEIVFTRGEGADSEIWLASLDRHSPPREITRAGDEAYFTPDGELIFRDLGEKENFVFRIRKDGSGRERVFNRPILDLDAVSPDGSWIVVGLPAKEGSAATAALPVHGGGPRTISRLDCTVHWSPDGKFLYVSTDVSDASSSGRTFVLPIPPGQQLPELPLTGIDTGNLADARQIDRARVSPGPDPSIYLFSQARLDHNLFRIPLH